MPNHEEKKKELSCPQLNYRGIYANQKSKKKYI